MANDRSTGPESESLPFLMLVPNLVTMLGLCAGLTAIRFVMAGKFELAVALVLFAILIDGVDGLLARRLQATSEIGAQLDSLSDFLNFGVTPGLLIYQYALANSERAGSWIVILLYVSCCCLRLARFNVTNILAAANEVKKPAHFVGVPAPAGAFLALLPVFIAFETGGRLSDWPVATCLHVALVGFLMVSRLPTFSPKSLRIQRRHIGWMMLATALVVGLLLTQFWLTLILMALGYTVTLVYAAYHHVWRRRT